MERKEELELLIKELKNKLSATNKELYDINLSQALAASEFKVGDRVLHGGKQFELTGHRLDWQDKVKWFGRLVCKDGTLGTKVFEMYGAITLIEGEK